MPSGSCVSLPSITTYVSPFLEFPEPLLALGIAIKGRSVIAFDSLGYKEISKYALLLQKKNINIYTKIEFITKNMIMHTVPCKNIHMSIELFIYSSLCFEIAWCQM